MILVSVSSDNELRRYDNSRAEGLTHVGRLIPGADDSREGVERVIERFRVEPPAALSTFRQSVGWTGPQAA